MTDMSQLQTVVKHLDKVLANDVADLKAASTIRGMELVQHRIQNANSSLERAKIVRSLGVDSKQKEMTSRREYELLLVNITQSSSRIGHERDANLATIGMLLQGVDDSGRTSKELVRHPKSITELRENNTLLMKLVKVNIADIKAASIVRGMELAAFNYLRKGSSVEAEDNAGRTGRAEVASQREYEEFVKKLDGEVAQLNRDRDHALETNGGMLQRFKMLDAQLAQVTASLSDEQERLKKLQASCPEPQIEEGSPKMPALPRISTSDDELVPSSKATEQFRPIADGAAEVFV
jgi:hypothetical protein